jgi:hypothetical protein
MSIIFIRCINNLKDAIVHLHIMKTTLKQWQTQIKSIDTLIFNASEHTQLNDAWVPYTIGMAVWFAKYNGTIEQAQIGSHGNLLLCAIRKHTDSRRRPNGLNRESIINTLQYNGFRNLELNINTYYNILPSYKFVASPEGNGIDCHRHYEALLAGCIPIIEYNEGIAKKYEGCPILFTNDYSEINEEYLNKKYEEMINKEYDFSKLFIHNYDKSIQNEIIDNGNYWNMRINGFNWYK